MAISTIGTNSLSDPIAVNGYTPTASNMQPFNRIINGAMTIDQRNAGASVTATSHPYTLDRWRAVISQAAKFTVQQNAAAITPPVGFTNYLGVTSSSAYSITSSDYFFLRQSIEGFNTADLAWGTASAATITLSFRVYSSLTGTFGGALQNNSQNRSYPFSYSIPTANTWTTISVTIAGDTTGTWETGSNSGMLVVFGLGVGTSLSGTAGAWVGAIAQSATGATSVVGTSGATFYITGVQLEAGSTASPFAHEFVGDTLLKCQRYYQLAEGFNGIAAGSGTKMYCTLQFKTEMRANPSVSANANIQITYPGVNDYTQSSPSVTLAAGRVSTRAIQVNLNNFTGLTNLSPLAHNVGVNNASITLSSEL